MTRMFRIFCAQHRTITEWRYLDVVAAADPAQFAMKREGDKVIGRGVYDCKGRAVAVAETLCALAGKDLSVGCIFGSDEELGGLTTTWMAVEKGYAPKKMAIVTDARCFVSCGVPIAIIGTEGGSAHGADEWDSLSSMDDMKKVLIDFLTQEAKRP